MLPRKANPHPAQPGGRPLGYAKVAARRPGDRGQAARPRRKRWQTSTAPPSTTITWPIDETLAGLDAKEAKKRAQRATKSGSGAEVALEFGDRPIASAAVESPLFGVTRKRHAHIKFFPV
jgi:hypothetical protein